MAQNGELKQPFQETKLSEVEPHMGRTPTSTDKKPSWFTPRRLLFIFCMINMLNYVDRGTMASNGVNGHRGTCTTNGNCTSGTGIQWHSISAFMVGLLVASPIFATLAKSVSPFRLIGVGLLVWTLSTTGCGFSFDFWSVAVCRMLVGVGEASFMSLAAPFIDDNAPASQTSFQLLDLRWSFWLYSSVNFRSMTSMKTAWLALFYMCIPTGYAVGYVYGGLVGSHLKWRYAFFGEAILMVPFVILSFAMKPLQLKGFSSAKPNIEKVSVEAAVSAVQVPKQKDNLPTKENLPDQISNKPSGFKSTTGILSQISRFLEDMKLLLVHKVFVVNVLGYVAYNFVIGAYSYWGPKAGYSIYNMQNADMIFGGITVVCGIVGTLAGGFALDFISSTISNAFKLLSLTTLVGAMFCFGAFCFKNMYGFLALFAVGELLVFATQAPVNFVCLQCVNPSLRPMSMAISTVSIHILGDVPSSPLVGVVQDHIKNWRATALILTSILFLAALIWLGGIFLNSVDRFNEKNEEEVSEVERSTKTAPLLEGRNGVTTTSHSQP